MEERVDKIMLSTQVAEQNQSASERSHTSYLFIYLFIYVIIQVVLEA